MGKIGVNTSAMNNKGKKKEEPKVTYINERPQSAKGKAPGTIMMVGREEMLVTGSGGSGVPSSMIGKRRAPGSIPKQ